MTRTHNEQFLKVQKEYLKTRDQKYLDPMYRVCFELAKKFVLILTRRFGLGFMDIDELAHDSAVKVINLYITKPGFKVKSINACLNFCCMEAMRHNKTWNKKTVSMEPLVEMELI
jgi:hypothetical protein